QLADVWTARQFGLEMDERLWTPLVNFLTKGGLPLPAYEAIFQQAETLAYRLRFFHWELEFPEVFFDRHGRLDAASGFDAVIGNPPYVRQEELGAVKSYFSEQFAEVYAGTADLFVYFFWQGMELLRDNGRLSYISSNSWLKANYAKNLRSYLRTKIVIETLIDLGDNRVFFDAPDLQPAIHVALKQSPTEKHFAQVAIFDRNEGLNQFETKINDKLYSVTIFDQPDNGWQLQSKDERGIIAKLIKHGKPLGDVVNGEIFFGIKTGLNKAFVIDKDLHDQLIQDDPTCSELIKPLVRGTDLRPWYQADEEIWLIVIPSGWTSEKFGNLNESDAWKHLSKSHPSIASHLSHYSQEARKRYDQGEYWWELRPCVYYENFEKPKIIYPDIAKYPRFSWNDTGSYVINTGYIITFEEMWLLGYLSSRCAWFLISNTSTTLGERAGLLRYRLFDQFIRPLPVPSLKAADREALGELAMQITEQAKARYHLHRQSRHRIAADLGSADKKLNQKLTAWWDLDFAAFRKEIKKVYKRDIALSERDEWEAWLNDRVAKHRAFTQEIVRLETLLNARVYALFDLSPQEIGIIEESTKYRYGEV
ncbi:MAG: Eco57I restriction-modification methylase domain-containing protein, partial [Anaerolineae bacterium]|nr:Eco57I restriction-modification methylase domain-containing protein [Anaerolineae bacterium]